MEQVDRKPDVEANPAQIRRSLARAERGAALDVTEATALLARAGEQLDRLCVAAARVRDAGLASRRSSGRGHLLAQGVHPADPAVPRPLPLLHVRHRAGPARPGGEAPYLSPDEVLEIARAGRRRSAARRRCSPSATGPRTAGREAREWLDEHGYDTTLAYVRAMAIRVLEETGLLPHLNPGVMTLGGDAAAQAGRAVDGDDAGDHVAAALRGAGCGATSAPPTRTRRSGCGCWRTPAGCSVPFTTGLLVGIGETLAERAESLFAIRRRRAAVRRDPGGHRPELPGQAGHRDAARRRPAGSTSTWPRSRSPGSCSARGCGCRRRRTWSTPAECRALLAAGVDDWGGVSPLTPGPRQPGAPVAAARRAGARSPRPPASSCGSG